MYNNYNSYYENPYTYGDYYYDDFAEDVFADNYGEYVPTSNCVPCADAGMDPATQPQDNMQGNTQDQSNAETPITNDPNYTQGYLQTLIGRRVKIEFILGTNMLIDREGTLLKVGISYVVIKEVDTNNEVMCDIYSIKFVNIFPQGSVAAKTNVKA